jgi:sulfur-oxidizing protein SoxZ
MGKPMRIRARAEGDVVEVKILISHIMETGVRKDQEGGLVPAHFIQLVTVTHQGRNVLSAQWGPAVSANPYMSFKFRGGRQGEKVTVKWTDNLGDSRSDETVIV